LDAPAAHTDLSATAAAIANGQAPPAARLEAREPNELAERVRPIVKRDPAVTANVLRMWLQENRAAETAFSDVKP
jgi:flagellar biosynthesis/type III secretory pathway M-ring protein FliF/YscJ